MVDELNIGNVLADYPKLDSLDSKSQHEWLKLSNTVSHARTKLRCSECNDTLIESAFQAKDSPIATAFHLWLADNLSRDGRYAESIPAYDQVIQSSQSTSRLVPTIDPVIDALYHKAQSALLSSSPITAIASYLDLAQHDEHCASDALLQCGLIAESVSMKEDAQAYYEKSADERVTNHTDNPSQLARRALERLLLDDVSYYSDVMELIEQLASLFKSKDIDKLERIISKTHFAIGPIGGHTAFESAQMMDRLWVDIQSSSVSFVKTLFGSGEKIYVRTTGWNGKWFLGDVMLLLHRAPQGWQWTGLAITTPNELWIEQWTPTEKQTNDPLPFELLAPWPEGQCFQAGGLNKYLLQQLAVIAGGFIGGPILAYAFSRNCCGWGPRGFFYNQGSTHGGEDAFAIDFTRYRENVPYDNESGGTPVLAARSGIVVRATGGTSSGNSSASNTVEIEHADPANPLDLSRFRTRYLHLEGPFKLQVSTMMPVFVGNRLGTMDDTGNSILDHLHFSIHDKNIPHPSSTFGASVRPTPMSGVSLNDGDSGRCVRSTNIEYVGEKPMIEAKSFAGQNWVITPQVHSVNQPAPRSSDEQMWLVILSGVAIIDLKGISTSQWRRETISLRPDIVSPIEFAINNYSVSVPPGDLNSDFRLAFQVNQWAPYSGLSSMYNKSHSIHSGFAVDTWRPNPFFSSTDVSTNAALGNLFSGIQVDTAVRDSDAILYRLSYNITLLGKIVFLPPIIVE